MRVARRIVLSDDERVQPTSRLGGGSTPPRLVLRARIVLRAAEGVQNQSIVEELSTELNTCALWRRRYLAARLPSLMSDAPRAGGPLLIPDTKIRSIVHGTLLTKPPNATHVSSRTMAADQGVSPSTARRLGSARRLAPHRLEPTRLIRDMRFEEKLRDVVGLSLDSPGHAVVLRVDEKTQIRALDRTPSILPVREGVPRRQTHDYRRNGTTELFAAFDVAGGTVIGECHNRHRARELLSFLRTLDRSTPRELDLHLVLDNLARRKTAKVMRGVLQHTRFHVHFVPTSSSWWDQVQLWSKDPSQRRIRRGTFHGEHDLIGAMK